MHLLLSSSALYSHTWALTLWGSVSDQFSGFHVEKTLSPSMCWLCRPTELNWDTTERWILPMILCFPEPEELQLLQIHQIMFRLLHISKVSCWILEINFGCFNSSASLFNLLELILTFEAVTQSVPLTGDRTHSPELHRDIEEVNEQLN